MMDTMKNTKYIVVYNRNIKSGLQVRTVVTDHHYNGEETFWVWYYNRCDRLAGDKMAVFDTMSAADLFVDFILNEKDKAKDSKRLQLLNALTPQRLEKMMTELADTMRAALSENLAIYMSCDNCPLALSCAENRHINCESMFYNYLEDATDDTNG